MSRPEAWPDREISARRRVVAALVAPIAGIVALIAIFGVLAIAQGAPVAVSMEGAVWLAFIAILIGAPFAYGTEALLLLAFGTIPPRGVRGVCLSAAIGVIVGGVVMPLLVRFSRIAVSPATGWLALAAVGGVIGGTAAAVYAILVDQCSPQHTHRAT